MLLSQSVAHVQSGRLTLNRVPKPPAQHDTATERPQQQRVQLKVPRPASEICKTYGTGLQCCGWSLAGSQRWVAEVGLALRVKANSVLSSSALLSSTARTRILLEPALITLITLY